MTLPRPAVLSIVLLVAGCHSGLTSPSPLATACVPSATSARIVTPLFSRPFTGDFPTGNLFDHDKPVVSDHNGYLVSMCGTRYDPTGLTDGHFGYDWRMPEGTPLLAVADGEVLLAGLESPNFCAPLNRTVQALLIELRHVGPSGDEFLSIYGHLSRIDVVNQQAVRAGDVIGRSGNTGCSGTPHLHFGVFKGRDGNFTVIDPYGWHAGSPDPWEVDPRGTSSVWLWRNGEAPSLR